MWVGWVDSDITENGLCPVLFLLGSLLLAISVIALGQQLLLSHLDSFSFITVREWEDYSAGFHLQQVASCPHRRSIVSSTVPFHITVRVDSFKNAITMPLAYCYFCFSDGPFPHFLCCPVTAAAILLASANSCRPVLWVAFVVPEGPVDKDPPELHVQGISGFADITVSTVWWSFTEKRCYMSIIYFPPFLVMLAGMTCITEILCFLFPNGLGWWRYQQKMERK